MTLFYFPQWAWHNQKGFFSFKKDENFSTDDNHIIVLEYK